MTNHLKVRVGEVEIEYEGNDEITKSDLTTLLAEVARINRDQGLATKQKSHPGGKTGQNAPGTQTQLKGTTKSIAAKLHAGNGPDLIRAAAAYLTLVNNAETFTQKQIGGEIKTAAGYYKTSMSKNLSKNIQRLIKNDVLTEHSTDQYALTPEARHKLEADLAISQSG